MRNANCQLQHRQPSRQQPLGYRLVVRPFGFAAIDGFNNNPRCWSSRPCWLTGYYAQAVRRNVLPANDRLPDLPSRVKRSQPEKTPS